MISIGAVIVTYNRLDKLKIALSKFDEQEVMPEYVIVVNNASTDGTQEYLADWEKQSSPFEKVVINCDKNSGGAGGFHTGLKESLKKNAGWIWVSDDDAYLEKDTLKNVKEYLENKDNVDQISAICGTVIDNNRIQTTLRRNIIAKTLRVKNEYFDESEYNKDEFELNCFSYVGTIINKNKMQEVGVTKKEYFIWFDDTEHSLRLSKVGIIICVPKIRVNHDTPKNRIDTARWKIYYGFRNSADAYKCHLPKRNYRYYMIAEIMKSYIKDIIGRNRAENKMIRKAMKDCRQNKFGIDEVYKPGWKIEK